MSLNVIDLIKGQLGPALVSQAAAQYGESESSISKAISALLPAVVGGMANNSNEPVVVDSIMSANSSGMLGNLLGNSSGDSLISSVVSTIFGGKTNGLINEVSGFGGVSHSTADSLLKMVTGAALGSLGKYAADNNLDRSSLSNLLADQKGVVSSLLPAGLSLGSLGLGGVTETEKPFGTEKVTVISYDEPKVEVSRGGNTHVNVDKTDENSGSIWKWLLPVILLALAAWFLVKQCDKKNTQTTTTTTDSTAVVSDSSATMGDSANVTANREMTDIDLNGTPIRGFANGMEASMITFLKNDGYKNADDDAALKDNWYSFDNVNFKMNSAKELEAGSEAQLQNLAAILKAYPDAKIKIGGYTDNTGDTAANKKLSQERADYIKNRLSDMGVGAQILGAEGYGSEFATVAANASDSERATDRKMAVRFAK
ncbi:OmpA family protein [Chryseobacterium sp.]|uniref:OmpA family protein n=1 Tax=Chryseobacterium sp. TaxID=1871047 RepID=UPI0011CABC19|nr:OmpA family protein [Chryseobacterium sp.]TXF77623.1 DUF937 domain-containing protein [Chryseobacterium sp.]